MTAHTAEFFTLDEVNRLKIIQDVVDRRLTTLMAAQRLGISDRQCRRLLSRYRESGPLGMANRRRGKPSNNQLPDGLARYALSIIRERYTDFGPTLACEKLAELHDVHLSKETVRSLMVKAGLWIPRKQRAPKIQQPRYRRACCGELIQIDGCDHHWFENRAPACTALVYVDDATSRLMQLRFVKSESTFTYFEATRGYLEKHGKPLALYSDKASVFRINNKNATGGDGYTQFGRAMHELNIQTICANTSSAKGRVERAHLTLQDRLVKDIGKYIEVWHYPDGHKELRLNGAVLPYSTYDRLQKIDQGAIVDNKRLGRTLEFINLVQDKRDNNRSQALPAGDGPSRRRRKPTEKKSQRSLNGDDTLEALKTLQTQSEEIFGTRLSDEK
ncbi:ISNCY family transposase [Enterobacter asburiae]|nr:ISNCY family transposase [Enterobacter asburiae]